MLPWLYRNLVPSRIRGSLWNLRTYLSSLGNREQRVRGRYALAEFYRSLGFTKGTAVLPDGTHIYIDYRDEVIGLSLFSGRGYEPAETAFFSAVLQPGMTVVDIGANIGYYSLLAARRVGPAGRVFAFEPDPYNHALLRANVKRNLWTDRVVIHNLALGQSPGQLTLWRSDSNFGDHRVGDAGDGRQGTLVPVDTFDNQTKAVIGQIDLLKIDVQGFEAKVFSGMRNTLATHPPKLILMEYWPHGIMAAGDDPKQLLMELLEHGYSPELLKQDGSSSPTTLDAIHACIPPHDPAQPDQAYVNLVLRH